MCIVKADAHASHVTCRTAVVLQVAGLWVLLALSVGMGCCLLVVYWIQQKLKRSRVVAAADQV